MRRARLFPAPRRRRSSAAISASSGTVLLVLIGGAFILWLIWTVLSALFALLATPYPWIVFGLGGLGYAIYRGIEVVQRERLEALFFNAVSALYTADPGAPDLLEALKHRGCEHADAMLLVAAGAASQSRFEDALSALDRATALSAGIGHLSTGMDLAFPGLPESLSFRADGGGRSHVEAAKAQLRALAGRPQEAIEGLKRVSADPSPLGASAIAQAYVALGDVDRAAAVLRQAAGARGCDPMLSLRLRYKLARLFEEHGATIAALREYEAIVGQGGHDDAATRVEALRAAAAAEQEAQRRATVEREERQRVEREELRRHVVRAQDEEALRWALGKLEGARGPAGRRAALQAGLDRLTSIELRERLMVEASRVEVEAVLDKVDGLKTAAAKRRHLVAALEALRADELPDELQAQQIRWLEEALAGLTA